jgi:nifR3 family TIM-barrel protein
MFKLTIGNLKLKNDLVLAPLAGFTDSVCRQIMVEHGAGLVFTEMVSAAGLSRGDKKTKELLYFVKKEKPSGIQLFGNKPVEFAAAAKYICNETDFDLIDINMGCPMRKVTNNGSGAGLMRTLPLAAEIINAVVSNSTLPVTVKFRSGWSATDLNYQELGRIAELEGAAAVCLHPRTRAQCYSGHADWQHIKDLAAALKIPVIGSGDVKTLEDHKRMLNTTKCAGVMIGRGAIGNPWLMQSIIADKVIEPAKQERIEMYLDHTRRALKFYSHKTAAKTISEMRKMAARYLTGFSGAAQLRAEVNRIAKFEELQNLFNGCL